MDLILPRGCAVCGLRIPIRGNNEYECFCDRCGFGVRQLAPPFCRICGTEVYGVGLHNPLCGKCLKNPPPFSIARSVVRYERQVQQLVHKLKYGNELSVIPGLKELIKRHDMAEFADVDCIVAVPLSLQRLRKRGLNQAVVLAGLFFADRPAAVKSDWLVRTRNTMPQTELGRAARMKNLRGAFRTRSISHFRGERVCLVDDVFTTGTTVTECSRVIMENGATEVKVLTLARVNVPRSGRCLSS